MDRKLIPLFAFSLFTQPQDEYFHHQWYLRNEGQTIRRDWSEISSYPVPGIPGADIGFPFNIPSGVPNRRAKPVVVAILDTGVDVGHPDLKDSILRSTECDSVGNIPPMNSPDRDGNGYRGDCAGYNFASNVSAEGDNQVHDDTGHGTHLAGLIAGKADSAGIRGISDSIRILPVKIFNKYENPNHPLRPKMRMMERIQKGLEYAIRKNADVINLSLGWPSILDSPRTRELISLAEKKGILIVAAAGNNAHHTTIFPCSYASVICVGASSVDGQLAPFSNFGGNVDVLAPGEHILSTIPKKITPLQFDQDGYDYKNGTSQSAPLVAGSAAFLKSVWGDIPFREWKARLISGASRSFQMDSETASPSLFGGFRLKEALEWKTQPFLYPSIKELNTVEVSGKDGSFSFPLKLENWIPSEVMTVKVRVRIPDAALDKERWEWIVLPTETEKEWTIRGQLNDPGVTSHQVMTLELEYGTRSESFRKELVFALNAEEVTEKVLFQESLDGTKLRSVEDGQHWSSRNFLQVQDLTATANSLTVYEVKRENVVRLFNLSRSSDWKVLSISMKGEQEMVIQFYDPVTKKLINEIWDVDQRKQVKSLDMVPDGVLFRPGKTTQWIGDGWNAVSLENGRIPKLDRNPSVFIQEFEGEADHLYWFRQNSGQMETRILDHAFFRKEIRRRYGLRINDLIFPVALQSKGRVREVDAFFAVGKGFERRLLLVRFFPGNRYDVIREFRVPGAGALKKIEFQDQSMLVLQERKEAYRVFDPETGDFREFKWTDRFDDLLGPIVRLAPDRLLVQTQNHLVVLGGENEHKIPIKRFSFLPGELFSEMFVPVSVQNSRQEQPALFIDGTLISDQHLGVVIWNGTDLVKPVRFQQKLPQGCRVMNPQRISGVDHLLLFCQREIGLPYLLKRPLSME